MITNPVTIPLLHQGVLAGTEFHLRKREVCMRVCLGGRRYHHACFLCFCFEILKHFFRLLACPVDRHHVMGIAIPSVPPNQLVASSITQFLPRGRSETALIPNSTCSGLLDPPPAISPEVCPFHLAVLGLHLVLWQREGSRVVSFPACRTEESLPPVSGSCSCR